MRYLIAILAVCLMAGSALADVRGAADKARATSVKVEVKHQGRRAKHEPTKVVPADMTPELFPVFGRCHGEQCHQEDAPKPEAPQEPLGADVLFAGLGAIACSAVLIRKAVR